MLETEIYIRLLEEGIDVMRPTQAIDMGNGKYKVLPTPDYDPEDEMWEYTPGSIVLCSLVPCRKGECLLAYKLVEEK